MWADKNKKMAVNYLIKSANEDYSLAQYNTKNYLGQIYKFSSEFNNIIICTEQFYNRYSN